MQSTSTNKQIKDKQVAEYGQRTVSSFMPWQYGTGLNNFGVSKGIF